MLAPRQAGQRGLIEQRQQGKSPCVPKLGKLGSWGRPLCGSPPAFLLSWTTTTDDRYDKAEHGHRCALVGPLS